jgi:hypothetical protein
MVQEAIAEEARKLSGRKHIERAAKLLDELIISEQFAEFMPFIGANLRYVAFPSRNQERVGITSLKLSLPR